MDTQIAIKSGIVKESQFLITASSYLKNRFPSTQFHFSFKKYRGGKSLKLYWHNGPTKPALSEFVEMFQGAFIVNMKLRREWALISLQDSTEYAHWGIDFIILKRSTSR